MTSKINIKIIIFSIVSLCFSNSVYAAGIKDTIGTPEDIAYYFSYSTTIQAMNERTQDSINYARQQIETLKNTNANWAVGEFSKLLDTVEQENINNCIALIDKAKASIAPSDISNARAALDGLLTVTYNKQVLDYANGLKSILLNIK